jgi:hypothetical protein
MLGRLLHAAMCVCVVCMRVSLSLIEATGHLLKLIGRKLQVGRDPQRRGVAPQLPCFMYE